MAVPASKSVGDSYPLPVQPGKKLFISMWKARFLYALLLPGFLYFIIYKYIPMLGIVIAFQDFSAFRGFIHSEWVGFRNFALIFDSKEIVRILFNTLYLSSLQLIFAFPLAIVLSLFLNELRSQVYKKVIQSIIYLPHFVSWVVVIGLVYVMLGSKGVVNGLLNLFHIGPINFLITPGWFMPLILLEGVWKETGWGTILFLAALAGVNPSLYEAAVVDGAGRWRSMWHITLPSLRGTIAILLILQLGHVLDTGLEQILLMINALTKEVGTTLDYYVYLRGILNADYSFATAFGLFKSLIGLILIIGANRLAKKVGETGVF